MTEKILAWIFSPTVGDFQMLYFTSTNKEILNPVFNILSTNAESNETKVGKGVLYFSASRIVWIFKKHFFFFPGHWVKLQANFLPTGTLYGNCLKQMRNCFLDQDTELKWKLSDLVKQNHPREEILCLCFQWCICL